MEKRRFTPSDLSKNELELILWKSQRFNSLREAYLSYMLQNIRTQMNNITGFSRLLAEEENNAEKRHSYYEQIEHSTTKLDKLVSDSLNISLMSLDQIDMQEETCYINLLMDDLYSYFTQQKKLYSKAYVELYSSQDVEGEEFAIKTDCGRLRQIFAQLIGNSLANCSDGDEIEFGYKIPAGGKSGIVCYVEDNASEYSKQDMDEILKQPEKFQESRTNSLQLESVDFMVLKTLIDLLDGEMSIITGKEKGIRYEVVLPYKPVKPEKDDIRDPSVDEIEELQRSFDWSDKKILVAEDVDANYTLLEEVLGNTKAKVFRAKNGKEAVEVFEDHPDIDLILMDIKMPVMDGLEATEKIKKQNPDVPVIAQTAFVVDFDKTTAMQAGCDDYISKPLNFEKLFKMMDLYLENM